MGQLFFTDETGRRWMCGWDNPSQGYYASRENDEPNPCGACHLEGCTSECESFMNEWEEFDVLIGFGKGVDEKVLWSEVRKYNFYPTHEQWQQILADRTRDERPLTPLQKNIHAMFEGLL